MVKGIVVGVEVPFGHDTEGPDSGQRAAVLAVQLVSAVAIDDQFALLAARQVDVVHQAVAGVVIIPVALVVHARALIAATALSVLARISPSSVRHRSLLARVALFGFVREDALAVAARGGSGKRRAAGACRRGGQRVV